MFLNFKATWAFWLPTLDITLQITYNILTFLESNRDRGQRASNQPEIGGRKASLGEMGRGLAHLRQLCAQEFSRHVQQIPKIRGWQLQMACDLWP